MIEGEGEERQEQLSIASFNVAYPCPGSTHPFPPASKERKAYEEMLRPFLVAMCLWMWVAPAVSTGTPCGPQTNF